jgi:peptide subunit release factor 1 (eRF1)
LGALVIGAVDIPIDATDQDVLAASRRLQEEHERDIEAQAVKEVLQGIDQKQNVVAGLGHTLNAVNSDRVWELVYSEGLASPGFECVQCTALFSIERDSCHYCGGSIRSVSNVIERAVDHVLRRSARIEVVTGQACDLLNTVGGIAAFVKAGDVNLYT